MKKLLTALVVLVLAAPLSAQISARRAEDNAKTCAVAKLQKDCTQAEYDFAKVAAAAEKPPVLIPPGIVYATDAAFRDAVIVVGFLAARQDEDINAAAAALNRAFVDATPAKRSIICTSAGIVC